MKLPDVTQIVGGCRRTFTAVFTILGLFIFGYLQDIDISNTAASVAIALAAANGAENVFTAKHKVPKKNKGETDDAQEDGKNNQDS